VRELRNFIERTLAVSGGIDPAEVPRSLRRTPSEDGAIAFSIDLARPFLEAREELLGQFERGYLERMLAAHDGNISRAARAAGLDRMHFKRLLARRQTPEET
jgi:DNA-binding NtrC family response regulator